MNSKKRPDVSSHGLRDHFNPSTDDIVLSAIGVKLHVHVQECKLFVYTLDIQKIQIAPASNLTRVSGPSHSAADFRSVSQPAHASDVIRNAGSHAQESQKMRYDLTVPNILSAMRADIRKGSETGHKYQFSWSSSSHMPSAISRTNRDAGIFPSGDTAPARRRTSRSSTRLS